jgi:hypothetical protein
MNERTILQDALFFLVAQTSAYRAHHDLRVMSSQKPISVCQHNRPRSLRLVEADDAVAMARWSHQWSDLLTIETPIVIDDDEFLKVLG